MEDPKAAAQVRESIARIAARAEQAAAAEAEDVLGRVGAVVRDFGPLLPASPSSETRDRIDAELTAIAERIGHPGAFDLQRGWLFGYLDGFTGATDLGRSPRAIADKSAWASGYERGAAEGTSSSRPVPETATTGAPAPGTVPIVTADPLAELTARQQLLTRVLIAITVATGLTWAFGIRSFWDALAVLVGAAIAALSTRFFIVAATAWRQPKRQGKQPTGRSDRFAAVLMVIMLTMLALVMSSFIPALGGAWPSVLWAVGAIVLDIMQHRIRERIEHPQGRKTTGSREYTARRPVAAQQTVAGLGAATESPGPEPGVVTELGLASLLTFCFGGFGSVFRYSRPTGRLEFWIFVAVGLVPMAALMIHAAGLIGQLLAANEFVAALMTGAGLAAIWLWWFLALLAVTARRLRDAQVARGFAFLWLLVPLATVIVFVVVFLAITLRPQASPELMNQAYLTALVAAAITAGIGSLVMLGAGLLPTRGAQRPHPRLTWRAVRHDARDAVRYMRDALTGAVDDAGPNTATGWALFGCLALVLLLVALPLDEGLRGMLLVPAGILFTIVHLVRWVFQERYFRNVIYVATYSRGPARAWKDPRWPRTLAWPHKLFGLGWIWMLVLTGASLDTPVSSEALWFIVVVGLPTYSFHFAIFGTPLTAMVWFIVTLLIPDPDSVQFLGEQGIISFAALYFIVWGLVVVMWWVRLVFVGPRDRRTNQYRAYQKHVRTSEW